MKTVPGMASNNCAVNSSLSLSQEEISPAPTKVTSSGTGVNVKVAVEVGVEVKVEVAVSAGVEVEGLVSIVGVVETTGEGMGTGGKQEVTASKDIKKSGRISTRFFSRKFELLEQLIITSPDSLVYKADIAPSGY